MIIGLHLVSHHANADKKYNNYNPGVYVRSDCGWQAGIYRNSEYGYSMYAGKMIGDRKWPIQILAGVATGYKRGLISFVGGFSIPLGPNLRFNIAPFTHANGAVAHLTIEWKF